ncbi:hypothetical protein [Cupriavidus taiwanensis]|nr:hypothetical protein [Cupriavidus taiwanensis]
MSRSIRTSICAAAKVVVQPVKFQLTDIDGKPHWFATQTLEITTHDGQQCTFEMFLEDGCNALTAGEPVVLPPVSAPAGEPA